MKIFLALLLALPQGIFPHATKEQDEVKTRGIVDIPRFFSRGRTTIDLADADHPSGYVLRPGCWAKYFPPDSEHAITLENDVKQLKIVARPGSMVEWECHGFMKKVEPKAASSD